MEWEEDLQILFFFVNYDQIKSVCQQDNKTPSVSNSFLGINQRGVNLWSLKSFETEGIMSLCFNIIFFSFEKNFYTHMCNIPVTKNDSLLLKIIVKFQDN